MSQDPFWRNVKAGATGSHRRHSRSDTPNDGVTAGGVKRFKARQLSQWTAGVQIWQRIHVTLNYWLFFSALKAFPRGYIPFFVAHINGTISLKKLQSQIIHCNPPFEDPNASNWAFMTYKLYLPFFFFYFFPSGVCFSSFPPRCGVTLSLSLSGCSLVSLQCTFSLSPLLLPQTMSF